MPQNTTTTLTAAQVMDKAASLMNDTAKTVYTYVAQLPYLSMALDELQEYFQLNNIPITNESSSVITIPIGTTQVNPITGYPPNTAPNYPADLIEIQGVHERLSGSSDPFTRLSQVDFLSHVVENSPTALITEWAWIDQRIKFPSCLTARELKLDYVRKMFPEVLDTISPIGIINGGPFLYYRTASLCSLFIGEDSQRATELNDFAVLAIDRITGISTKGRQFNSVRRRPFLSNYRKRGY